jgi:hypothetical protein
MSHSDYKSLRGGYLDNTKHYGKVYEGYSNYSVENFKFCREKYGSKMDIITGL